MNPHPGPDDDSHYLDVKSLSKSKALPALPTGVDNTLSSTTVSGPSTVLAHETAQLGDIIADSTMLQATTSIDLPVATSFITSTSPGSSAVLVEHAPETVQAGDIIINSMPEENTSVDFSLASGNNPTVFAPASDSGDLPDLPASEQDVPLAESTTIATESHSLEDPKSGSEEELDEESEEGFGLKFEYDESGYLSRRPVLLTPENIVKNTIQQLAGYQLVVDPNFNRIICLVCQSLIPFERVHRHAYGHTISERQKLSKARQIPSQENLEQLLILLDAHQPVTLGKMPIPPFEDALTGILEKTTLIGLGVPSTTYVPPSNTHARSLLLDHMEWDLILKDVDLAILRPTAHAASEKSEPHLYHLQRLVKQYYSDISKQLGQLDILTRRLIRSPEPKLAVKHKPFMVPQEHHTLSEYSDFIAYFLVFILRHLAKPIAEFPVSLHPETLVKFTFLEQSLEDSLVTDSSIVHDIHACIWALLSCPSDKFLRNDKQDPFTRFLITYHLKDDYGTLASPPQFPHNLSRAQWCFRATACWEIIRLSEISGASRQETYEKHVKAWIHEGEQHMFNSLRQSMLHLTVIAKAQPGIARFNWNTTRTCLSIDGFPIVLKQLYEGLDSTILRVESLLEQLFRGCSFQDILKYIDSRIDPSADRAEHWFKDDPKNEDIQFSVFSMQENNLKQFEHRLLRHLSKDTKLFQQIQGAIRARAELWEWFGLLDEIVGLLFCLASTTWGGGARGTECDDMRYANNKDGGRHMFIINNTLTFISTYTKSRNIHGVTRQVAHSPSFRVSRLLLLLLSSVYPAAAHMAVMCLMPKEQAENYLTHVFVQSGQIMKTDNFSKALASFTKHTLNCPMGKIDFHLPDEDDEDLKMVHDLFNHSVRTGEQHYALQINDALPGFSHTSIASDQRVCFRWHACINQLHPSLAKEIKGAIIDQDDKSQQDSFSQLDACLHPMLDSLKIQLQHDYEEMQNKMLSRLEDYMQIMAPYIAQEVIHAFGLTSPPQPQPPQHVIQVHPQLLSKVKMLMPPSDTYSWTCPEQAELVQTCLTDKHVIAVLPTGTGKTLSFFSAAILHPQSMFLVIIPLTSLVEDMQHRLNRTSIRGSIYPQSDAVVDRIVLVPYHLVTTDNFRAWASAASRIKRIFMDESHHIYTSQFRQVFHLLKVLTSLGKPITFLSATIFPRSVDLLCDWMNIPRSIVHEIRSANPSRNIEFSVQHISDTALLEDKLVKHVHSIHLQLHERGLIYCRTKIQVEKIARKLGFPLYHSSLDTDEVTNNNLKKQRQYEWRNAMEPSKQWMVATMGFGQGIDYPSVRHIVHYEVHSMMHFIQEVGRGGRDGSICHSMLFYSKAPFLDKNAIPGDHTGVAEMKHFLETQQCRLLELKPIDGIGRSCASFNNVPLCDNCRKLKQENASSLVTLPPPSFSLPLIKGTRKRSAHDAALSIDNARSSIPQPLNVSSNSALLQAAISEAEDELFLLKKIIDRIVALGQYAIFAGFLFENTLATHLILKAGLLKKRCVLTIQLFLEFFQL
ncbi:hypothetical protein C0992_010569 [Termitomyces sp. T32_za158]|nr:hypothetical protein C0992_010569 [Termitomyces sp. T32_za158]